MNLEKLRYPIGRFEEPETISGKLIKESITILEVFPEQLRELVGGLDNATLDSPYRPDGWTIRQLVHHIADSHHHSYVRFLWALTENNPTIKAYDQKTWAELSHYSTSPISWSLNHLDAVHHKLVNILGGLSEEQWNRTFRHPETNEESNLKVNALRYAWHSMHHYAHIKNALERMG